MFGKKKTTEELVTCKFEQGIVHVSSREYQILREVRHYMLQLKIENESLKGELKAIKPVIESPDYKPPKSRECSGCQYAVYSPWDRISVIGCRKDCLCEDFKPKKED